MPFESSENGVKRGRGRPPKNPQASSSSRINTGPKRRRGNSVDDDEDDDEEDEDEGNRNAGMHRSGSSSVFLRDSFGSSALAGSRRPRRRPIDPTKDLLVLMPWDDPTKKIGVTANEMGEFALCLEEQVDYEDYDDEDDGHGGSSSGTPAVDACLLDTKYGGNSSSSSSAAMLKSQVYTPTVTVNKFFEARQKKGCGFHIDQLGGYVKGCMYDDYDADSDDEAFVTSIEAKYGNQVNGQPDSRHFVIKSLSPVAGVANTIRNSFLGGLIGKTMSSLAGTSSSSSSSSSSSQNGRRDASASRTLGENYLHVLPTCFLERMIAGRVRIRVRKTLRDFSKLFLFCSFEVIIVPSTYHHPHHTLLQSIPYPSPPRHMYVSLSSHFRCICHLCSPLPILVWCVVLCCVVLCSRFGTGACRCLNHGTLSHGNGGEPSTMPRGH